MTTKPKTTHIRRATPTKKTTYGGITSYIPGNTGTVALRKNDALRYKAFQTFIPRYGDFILEKSQLKGNPNVIVSNRYSNLDAYKKGTPNFADTSYVWSIEDANDFTRGGLPTLNYNTRVTPTTNNRSDGVTKALQPIKITLPESLRLKKSWEIYR